MSAAQADMASLVKQINPPEGYSVPAAFGVIGPRLLKAGAMKAESFIRVYEQVGLMELMASQGASRDEMFQAAKFANTYWYPQQSLELAIYFKAAQKVSFDKVDSRQLVSQSFFSLSGFQTIHQWLTTNGLLQQAPEGGNSCGV